MLRTTRRVCLAGATGAVLLAAVALLWTSSAAGQVRPIDIVDGPGGVVQPNPNGKPGESGSQFSAIKLTEKSEYRQFIEVARDCIKDKEWNDAVTALQKILDHDEDFYVRVKDKNDRGREIERWTSVKFEANNLLGSMPAEGLDVYELRVGASARQLLDKAKKTGDIEVLGQVAQRYLHTKVGAEANELLATYFLDRGQFFMAALRYERLMALNPKRVTLPDLTLYKAALAYRRAGDAKNADAVWDRLQQRVRGQGGIKIGEQVVSLDRLQAALDKIPQPKATNPHDWVLVRGNLTNSAQANGSPPLLDEQLWKRPTLLDKSDITGDVDTRDEAAKRHVDLALGRNPGPNNPLMPGFFPLASAGRLIYRTYTGVNAVLLHDLKEDGKVIAKAGEIDWKSTDFEGSLAVVLSDPNLRNTLEQWIGMYNQPPGFSDILYENTMVGLLSSDGRQVYAVDDLAVPAPPQIVQQWQFNQNQVPQQVRRLVDQNSLRAFDLQTGKEVWWLGNNPKRKDEFQNSHFLGAPLSVGGKLYTLNEKNNGELALVCLDPATGNVIPPVQMLGTVDQQARLTRDISRRTNTIALGYGEGILVCPTNAGEVLGVDLLSRTLAWAYPYREKTPAGEAMPIQPFPRRIPGGQINMSPANWYFAPPVLIDGKVVFTAPDAHSVHCINLRDGKPVWKARQEDGDLYLGGVIAGKVLIVGKNGVRLRSLADGSQTHFIPTGDVPSGQGVASNDVYYLPLRKGEVCAIDVKRGVVKAHNRASAANPASPGNLVFYEGAVLSQTATDVVAYPQLTAKLELANAEVTKDPTDLAKLTTRGELRLADGQVQGAVDDLRNVWEKKPGDPLAGRVREKLYLAMTDLFQTDFEKASSNYLKEYRELCKVEGNPKEEGEREARFLRLLGQGREAQGRLVEAFSAYREFGALPINKESGVPLAEDPTQKIPTPVWLKGRISAMIARATPEQRQPLEAKIEEEWKEVQAKGEVDAVRSFVTMFDVPFTVGRKARIRLAEAIIDKGERDAYLEAELNLHQLRAGDYREDPEVGGKALDTLARLEIKRGTAESMRQAAAYYRQIGEEFPKAVLRDGKTGQQLVNELAGDKRFLAYMPRSGPGWGNAKILARDVQVGAFAGGLQGMILQPEGDLTASSKNYRLILDTLGNLNNPQLRLLDMAANKVRWTLQLGAANNNTQAQYFQFLNQQANNNTAYYPNARFRFYHVKGNLAVLQVGTVAYAVDLENARILWQHSLLEMQLNQPNVVPQQVMPDQDGNLQFILWNQFNGQRHAVRIGHVGAVEAPYVALLKQKSLVVLDPLRGTTLWSRPDMPADTQVFGDDRHIFLVDVSNGTASGGRALRATDGTPVPVADFSHVYQHRLHTMGRRILAATPGRDGLTVRLYDIVTGKDVWSKSYDGRSMALQTEDESVAGVLLPDGKLVVHDGKSGNVLMEGNVAQGRITADDAKNLHRPLLLKDAKHFYVALNKPTNQQVVAGGIVSNNFSNGLRCAPVNGWVVAFHRDDGEQGEKDRVYRWKKGEIHWHSYAPIANQMIVLEQFENLPVLLFSARYNEIVRGGLGGQRWVSVTQSIDKRTGKMIYDPIQPRLNNGVSPQFYAFQLDLKEGTINFIGYNGSLQHYVDDGRKRTDTGAALPGQGNPVVNLPPGAVPNDPAAVPPGVIVRPGLRINPGRVIRRPAVPPVEVPDNRK
jgi:outer membrane protein assembly factor BamB